MAWIPGIHSPFPWIILQITKQCHRFSVTMLLSMKSLRTLPSVSARKNGSATLGLAIHHCVPAIYKSKPVCGSISHQTVDFKTVLRIGLNGIRKNAENALKIYKGTQREPFVRSCLHCLDCFSLWHQRYLDALKNRAEYSSNYHCLQRVPMEPPTNFQEAVQSLWFTFAFLRLCGNWPGIGRIDWLLGSYLEHDLHAGTLTIEEAREILAHFFIKGCEWVCGGSYGSGDAQHYISCW